MKKLPVTVLVLCLLGLVFASCATTPIEQQYPERWEKTKIGMTLEEFKQVWPEAKYTGYGADGKTAIYTFSPAYVPFSFPTRMMYSTFENDKLIEYHEI